MAKESEKIKVLTEGLENIQNDEEVAVEESVMSEWHNVQKRAGAKRKPDEEGSRKPKRKKLDPLVDWGMTDVEEEVSGVRDWLMGVNMNSSQEKESRDAETNLDLRKQSRKMKQLEIDFRRVLDPVEVQQDGGGGAGAEAVLTDGARVEERNLIIKMTPKRKKTLKKLAVENRKMTTWLTPERRAQESTDHLKMEMMESAEIDSPVLEETVTIERRELAKRKQKDWLVKKLVGDIIGDVVDSLESRSIVGGLLDTVLDRSWWRCKSNGVWSMLQDDPVLQEEILWRIKKQKEDLAGVIVLMLKEDRLERCMKSKRVWQQKQIEVHGMKLMTEMMWGLMVSDKKNISQGYPGVADDRH